MRQSFYLGIDTEYETVAMSTLYVKYVNIIDDAPEDLEKSILTELSAIHRDFMQYIVQERKKHNRLVPHHWEVDYGQAGQTQKDQTRGGPHNE